MAENGEAPEEKKPVDEAAVVIKEEPIETPEEKLAEYGIASEEKQQEEEREDKDKGEEKREYKVEDKDEDKDEGKEDKIDSKDDEDKMKDESDLIEEPLLHSLTDVAKGIIQLCLEKSI